MAASQNELLSESGCGARSSFLAEEPLLPPQCPTCGAGPLRPWDWSGVCLGYRFELMRCGCCGSLSSLPIPSSELIEHFYAQCYDYRWFAAHLTGERRDAAERVTELAPLLGPRVLDLGGGLGYLTEALRKRGFDASLYDPFTDRVAVRPTPRSFDTVVCLHVLEHTRDPLTFLHDATSFLKAGGHLILAVPNASGAGYRQRAMQWAWAQPPLAHIHHFTPQGMLKLLDRAGLYEPHLSFHERWNANSASDIASVNISRAMDLLMWRIPMLNHLGLWRKAVAWVDIQRRFRQLEKTRRSSAPVEDRAELLVSARKGA